MLRADVRVVGAFSLLLGQGEAFFGGFVEAFERVHRGTSHQSARLLTNTCLWRWNQSNWISWGALWICLRRQLGTGSTARSPDRRRCRNAAGRRWPLVATSLWLPRQVAARPWPLSCGALTA